MPRVYAGATVALGTMHGKEEVIAPALRNTVGLDVAVPREFDTDRFGSFTRDIQRVGSMEDAARAKAEAAMAALTSNLGLASEGSYGPHPALPLIAGGQELLLFIDRDRGLAITETLVTADVTFAQVGVRDLSALAPFLQRVGFPQQWLVLRPADTPDAVVGMTKGVADPAQLAQAFTLAQSTSRTDEVLVETDMRAFANPRRRRVIARLARRLGERLARNCPACDAPGFGGDRPIAGLPCAACGEPTSMPMAHEHECSACGYVSRNPVEELTADPGHCASCNP